MLTLEGFQADGQLRPAEQRYRRRVNVEFPGWEGAPAGNYVSREIGEPGKRTGTMISQVQVQF